jgi:hypothetical protein
MADATGSATRIPLRLDRLRAGDQTARDERLTIACERPSRPARQMEESSHKTGPKDST